MEKICLCIVGCLIFSGLFSQQTNFSFSSSHGISNRHLYSDGVFSSFIKSQNNLETYYYSNQHVLSVEKNTIKKISYSIGIGLQRKSVKLSFDLSNLISIDPRHDFEYDNTFEDVDRLVVAQKDYFLVLPIHVRYNVINRNKLQLYGSIGIKPHLYLKSVSSSRGYSANEKIVYRNKSEIDKEQNKLINPALDVAVIFDYKLNEQFSIRTNLLGDVDILSNTTNFTAINERWYTLYASLGLVYTIQ